MADSCRPVSRHGRYNSSGPSSMQFSGDVSSYGNVDYPHTDEINTEPERMERPRTSRGYRSREKIERPKSRRSRQAVADEESSGRPISRVGFSPESKYRYSHDEYSRQASSENERQVQNSPCDSPEILYRDDEYFNNQKALMEQQQQQQLHQQETTTDRLIVSPSGPQDLMTLGAQKSRKSPSGSNRKSPYSYGQSPNAYSQSPQQGVYGQSPQQGFRQSPQYESPFHRPTSRENRPTSREYLNVSPLHRDEPQLDGRDLHHRSNTGSYETENPYMNEGDAYQQRFADSSYPRQSPYRDNHRDSPYRDYRDSPTMARDSPYYGSSPSGSKSHGNHGNYGTYGSPEGYSRPPPAPRPKSARPKTGRKKSARVRQQTRHQEQETSPPQQCDTSSILNTGDPYGRPSSSLSPYKPLPSIGAITPREGGTMSPRNTSYSPGGGRSRTSNIDKGQHGTHGDTYSNVGEQVTVKTQKLSLTDRDTFHPADDDADIFSVEDIQGAPRDDLTQYTGSGVPNVSELTDLQRKLANEIFQTSVANYEQNIAAGEGEDTAGFDRYGAEEREGLGHNETAHSNPSPSAPKPLDFLHEIPDEPTDGQPRLLLAIKLPDGRRLQRFFSPDDRMITVMHFAENTSLANYEDYHLICNAPRTIFSDLSVRITDTQIEDRTVLYMEEKDE